MSKEGYKEYTFATLEDIVNACAATGKTDIIMAELGELIKQIIMADKLVSVFKTPAEREEPIKIEKVVWIDDGRQDIDMVIKARTAGNKDGGDA